MISPVKDYLYSIKDTGMKELNINMSIQELGLASGVYFLRVSSSGRRNYSKTPKFEVL